MQSACDMACPWVNLPWADRTRNSLLEVASQPYAWHAVLQVGHNSIRKTTIRHQNPTEFHVCEL